MSYNIIYHSSLHKFNNNNLVPAILPNNIKKLIKYNNISTSEMAEDINIKSGYLCNVANSKNNLSGITTMKLLKKYNISFNTLYNIKDTTTIQYKDITDDIFILESKSSKCKNDLYKIIADISNKYSFNDKNPIVRYLNLVIIDGKLQIDFTQENVSSIPKSVLNTYQQELEKFQSSHIKIKNSYYLIVFENSIINTTDLTINTYNNLDIETTNLLNTIPFKKAIVKSIAIKKCIIHADEVELDKYYHIITKTEYRYSNKIKITDHTIDNDKINIITLNESPSKNKLKAYRYIKGYSIEDMANIFQILPDSYRLLEIGANAISTQQMWIIENVLGILLENIVDINAYLN